MKILFQDEHYVAVHKPAGFHVHPPEDPTHKVPREKIVLYEIRRQLNQYVYPVHRLDAGTSGVLLFGLSSEAASRMNKLFTGRLTEKTYNAVIRGYVPDTGTIEVPLESDSSGEMVEAKTLFKTLARIDLPVAVGKKFPTSQYSWMEVTPHTGRFHQIRRHFNRISRPLLGDATHGDSRHNQFFRKRLGIEGLCLKAMSLGFTHPFTNEAVLIQALPCAKWNKIQDLFANPQAHVPPP